MSSDDPTRSNSTDDPNTLTAAPAWKRFLIPLSMLGGFVLFSYIGNLGSYIGKQIGARYESFGEISGVRIGEWLGWGVGVATAVIFTGFFIRDPRYPISGTTSRRVLTGTVIWGVIVLSTVVAVGGEALLGELGGPAGFMACWTVLFGAAYSMLRGKSGS